MRIVKRLLLSVKLEMQYLCFQLFVLLSHTSHLFVEQRDRHR